MNFFNGKILKESMNSNLRKLLLNLSSALIEEKAYQFGMCCILSSKLLLILHRNVGSNYTINEELWIIYIGVKLSLETFNIHY